VFAPHDGKVSSVYFDPKGLGNQIDILSPVENGVAYLSTLAHLTSQRLIKPGQKIKRGEVIASVGNSGRSTGAHLHYEVIVHGVPVDPRKFVLDRSL
jgi:murein DD-endopeptidase MepM/ murein hydrolase activator NlpD